MVMKQIRKMIVGIAIMLLGISFAIHGGFVENTALLVTGGGAVHCRPACGTLQLLLQQT